jgi:hypothetical protein
MPADLPDLVFYYEISPCLCPIHALHHFGFPLSVAAKPVCPRPASYS